MSAVDLLGDEKEENEETVIPRLRTLAALCNFRANLYFDKVCITIATTEEMIMKNEVAPL
jgi:hypothetical protein